MSRGPGRVQRAILAALAEHQHTHHPLTVVRAHSYLPSGEVAAAVFGNDPTGAQLESTRRALRTLAARGLVQLTHHSVWLRPTTDRERAAHARSRSTYRFMLAARLAPADDQEAERWERHEGERVTAVRAAFAKQ
jgi:hypothetical protein